MHIFSCIQVPLGVILKNENVIDDMVDILDTLHRYVPKHTRTETIDVPTKDGSSRKVDMQLHHFHHILLGGDHLTAARVRGSQRAQKNADSGEERLEGLVPVIEDWHAKMCYMSVSTEGVEKCVTIHT